MDFAEKKAERAAENFKRGYNCAQAVLVAFSEEIGLDEKTAARLASSFGGGMGRLREVCGAVSAMFMVIGLRYGYDDPAAIEEKASHYAAVQELAARFTQNSGSIICRTLLEGQEHNDAPVPEARTGHYYDVRPCGELVADAASILADYIVARDAGAAE